MRKRDWKERRKRKREESLLMQNSITTQEDGRLIINRPMREGRKSSQPKNKQEKTREVAIARVTDTPLGTSGISHLWRLWQEGHFRSGFIEPA